MKKIPTLFKREFKNHKFVSISQEVTDGCECDLNGECVPTVKWDGACCAVINGELYKRYDAKNGKPVPDGAIKCQEEPDPITGHLPCWMKCDRNNPADKWFFSAFDKVRVQYPNDEIVDGTYEAIGRHFQGNPYELKSDELALHGADIIEHDGELFTFDGIKQYLSETAIEGIVFWKDGKPVCKIKRSDFDFAWGKR